MGRVVHLIAIKLSPKKKEKKKQKKQKGHIGIN